MKINKINQIFRKSKHITLYNYPDDNGEIIRQYITDGSILVPLENMPIFDKDNILGFLERSADDTEIYVQVEPLPLKFENIIKTAEHKLESIKLLPYTLFDLNVFTSKDRLFLANPKYIKPFINDDAVLFDVAKIDSSGDAIIVYNGMIFAAAIMPVEFSERYSREMADTLQMFIKTFTEE